MSGSRHIQLYSHLLDCEHCRITDQLFCKQATAMGVQYTEHLEGFAEAKRGAMHDEFVCAVVKGRVKRWYGVKQAIERAAA